MSASESERKQLDVRCIGCKKRPDELSEYVEPARAEREEGLSQDIRDMFGLPSAESGKYYPTPEQYVIYNEGTYNPATGHFLCTDCYIKAGMPTRGGDGWKAP